MIDGEMGALELYYPGRAIYPRIFESYLPEIADDLVARQEVRFLVEVVWNAKRAGELLFDMEGVSETLAQSVLTAAEELAALLWDVCDRLASLYRLAHDYDDE